MHMMQTQAAGAAQVLGVACHGHPQLQPPTLLSPTLQNVMFVPSSSHPTAYPPIPASMTANVSGCVMRVAECSLVHNLASDTLQSIRSLLFSSSINMRAMATRPRLPRKQSPELGR